MGNDPINNVDPSGGLGINFGTIGQITGSVLADRALITLAGAAVGFGVDKLTGGNGWTGAAIGGGVALGATFIPPFSIGDIGSALGKAAPSIAIQGVKVAADIITQPNPYAQWAGYNPQQPITVDNTKEAWNHYIHGNGEPVNIGTNTTLSLLTSPEFKLHESRIVSGLVGKRFMNGNFSVDMTKRVFHIGRTNVDYSIKCGTQGCTVTFNLFVRDGFWDVDFIDENTLGEIKRNGKPLLKQYQPDGMGPNLERFGGHPYPYNPVTIKFTFINPGY